MIWLQLDVRKLQIEILMVLIIAGQAGNFEPYAHICTYVCTKTIKWTTNCHTKKGQAAVGGPPDPPVTEPHVSSHKKSIKQANRNSK